LAGLTAFALAAYFILLPGLSSARTEPPAIEVNLATWLLGLSVPADAKNAVNPLGADLADTTAGNNLFQQKCETCHAYDGSGNTLLGLGLFPRAPNLKPAVSSMTDGEIFYHIQEGIRNTAMPAFTLPERQIWQLVTYIRALPKINPEKPLATHEETLVAIADGHYVGSPSCASCHEDIYNRWKDTKMANVVRDPRLHPDAIIPDLSIPDPLLTFTLDDIALTYGSGWKQRYFKKVGDDYFPFPAQWDVTNKVWRRYHAGENTDWWVPFYPDPGDNSQRPTGPLCDGCHSVGYNIETKAVAEWNVGCESCHGAGSVHALSPLASNILNPSHMHHVDADDTCIQCHSQGQPLSNPINGTYYDWAVGFKVGLDLADFWKLEEHELGTQSFTHFADGSAHKNRMQGNDYIQSQMYKKGVTCSNCHDVHGTENDALLREPKETLCLSCHAPNSQNGPRADSVAAHTHHREESEGSECVSCHMPKIAATVADINVRSHTFKFITPTQSETMGVPNACNLCHKDETAEWATTELSNWENLSHWRMKQ